ncbi:peptidyl-prolyl cis-trans isomerase, cyclophilin-type [Dictyocaulus viviparus]|uniref:Peptidyl-prolyl cis-trans isomerase n=1 Tax=Dictyocaulus viviparus TaxID=29172 RepID=A0A0D8YE60_DICVI|nr:peptidyl-prolyl cis-trans isomerase, cyclophilin-type [Dictyocaulus viviparus]
MPEKPTKVFMDISADKEPIGRLVFELNTAICPKTSENFRRLCTGEEGFGYKGCIFYRIIPGFCACSGDFETQNADRSGGRSTFGKKYFDDENHTILHDKRGILSMDNFGWPNTNSSRFFVTFTATPWMNNFHVAFGELVEGFDVLDKMESYGILEGYGAQKGRTSKLVAIDDCGQLQ